MQLSQQALLIMNNATVNRILTASLTTAQLTLFVNQTAMLINLLVHHTTLDVIVNQSPIVDQALAPTTYVFLAMI